MPQSGHLKPRKLSEAQKLAVPFRRLPGRLQNVKFSLDALQCFTFQCNSGEGDAAGSNVASHVVLFRSLFRLKNTRILWHQRAHRQDIKVRTVRIEVGLPFVVGEELLRLAQSLLELSMRIHDVGQGSPPYSGPMRRISRHPEPK